VNSPRSTRIVEMLYEVLVCEMCLDVEEPASAQSLPL
jgi:hypothetical protein